MKQSVRIILIVVAMTAIFSAPFVLYFGYFNYTISSNTDLANFGNFVGGILTPILTSLGFVVLIYQVVRSNQNSSEANSIYKLEKFESQIDHILNGRVNITNVSEEMKDMNLVSMLKYSSNFKFTFSNTDKYNNIILNDLKIIRDVMINIMNSANSIEDSGIRNYFRTKYSRVCKMFTNHKEFYLANLFYSKTAAPINDSIYAKLNTFYNDAYNVYPVDKPELVVAFG